MADPVVHITNGVPDSGTGNITTLGQTLTDGANATLGANADAASATGSISAKLRALVTAIGTTAWDLGVSTGGSRTQRVAIDTSQLAALLAAYDTIANKNAQQVALPTDHPTLAMANDTSRILNGASGTSLTPKWATIAVSSSGDNTIVAAVTSKKIRVLFWDLAPNAAVNAKWRSSTTTDKTGLYYMANQGNGHARSFNPVGWFETASGEALTLNLSGAVAVGGLVGYIEV